LAGGLAWFRAGRKGDERAWFTRYTDAGESEEAEASAAPPRWGGASVPARNKTSPPAMRINEKPGRDS